MIPFLRLLPHGGLRVSFALNNRPDLRPRYLGPRAATLLGLAAYGLQVDLEESAALAPVLSANERPRADLTRR